MRACACFIVLGLAISINGGSTFAQSATPEVKSAVQPQPGVNIDEVQTRRTSLFQRMLEKPDDLDAAFEYAALSVQVGDLEAAVSTLERMLIFAPGLPRLQLELGVLYYRLSAFETARSYFEAAVAGPDVPEEVRSKVEQYLVGNRRCQQADPLRRANPGRHPLPVQRQSRADRRRHRAERHSLHSRSGRAGLAGRQRLWRRVSSMCRAIWPRRETRSRPIW